MKQEMLWDVFGLGDILQNTGFRPWWETGGKVCTTLMFLATIYMCTYAQPYNLVCLPQHNDTCQDSREVAQYIKAECSFRLVSGAQRNLELLSLLSLICAQLSTSWWLYVPVVRGALSEFAKVLQIGDNLTLTRGQIWCALSHPNLEGSEQGDIRSLLSSLRGVLRCGQVVLLYKIRSQLAVIANLLICAFYCWIFAHILASGRRRVCHLPIMLSAPRGPLNGACLTSFCSDTSFDFALLSSSIFAFVVAVKAVFALIGLCRISTLRKHKRQDQRSQDYHQSQSKNLIFQGQTVNIDQGLGYQPVQSNLFRPKSNCYIVCCLWFDLGLNLTRCGFCSGCHECCRKGGRVSEQPLSPGVVEFLLNLENRSVAQEDRGWLELCVRNLITERSDEMLEDIV